MYTYLRRKPMPPKRKHQKQEIQELNQIEFIYFLGKFMQLQTPNQILIKKRNRPLQKLDLGKNSRLSFILTLTNDFENYWEFFTESIN